MSTRWLLLLVAVAALLVHSFAKEGEFVFYDDYRYVVQNPAIDRVGNPLRFFSDLDTLAVVSPTRDIYRPVRTLSYAVIASGWGREDAAPFHALAILLHAATAALLAALLLRAGLGRFGSAVGALFFAVHPATVEVTAWVCSLGDAWCGLFSVASVLAWAADRRLLAVLALVPALFSKEHAVVVPGLWVAWDLCLRPERFKGAAWWRTLLTGAAPGLAIAVGFLLLRLFVAGARMAQVDAPLGGSHLTAVLTMTAGLGWYAATILFPYGPTFGAVVTVPDTLASPGVVLGLAALAALVWPVVRGPANVRLGALWFLIALVPVSNVFVPLKIPTADRFLYLPLMGLALALGELARRTYPFSAKWMTPSLAVLALLCVTRIGDWRDSESLLAAGLRVDPKSQPLLWEEAAVAAEKAVTYLERGDLGTAEILAQRAVEGYGRYLRNSLPGEQTQVYVELGDLYHAIALGRARVSAAASREAMSRALEAYAAARSLQRQRVGQTSDEYTRHVAERIVQLSVRLAEPSNPSLAQTITVGLEAADFLREAHGVDDTPARMVLRLADSVRVRGREPERAREGFDWVLEAIDRLEAQGRRLTFERAQVRFYRAILRDLAHDRAELDEAFRLYMEAAQADPRIRLRALTYAGRCQCTIARIFGEAEAKERGLALLASVPAVAARDGLRLDAELRDEIRTIESGCGR